MLAVVTACVEAAIVCEDRGEEVRRVGRRMTVDIWLAYFAVP